MAATNFQSESPMSISISFHKLIEKYEEMLNSNDEYLVAKANRVLDVVKKFPELKEGFTDYSLLDKYKDEISIILEDSFSSVLTKNEIKTASIPFENIIFNSSERFKSIINAAGDDFELVIRNMPEDGRYIIACTIILQLAYGYSLDFKRPFFYEIPDAKGILRYYKILYNADFTEIVITDNAPRITDEDVDELLDNFNNIDLWKEKFPPNSYIFKGFVISNIFDVTDDQSISQIKSSLISDGKKDDQNLMEDFHEVFRSLLNIKELKVGFSVYTPEEKIFEKVHGDSISSFLVNDKESCNCLDSLCHHSYEQLIERKEIFAISDVNKYYELSEGKAPQFSLLKSQGIQSAIFAPIADENGLMGILELVSDKPKVLNSINANKLVDIMPYIVSSVQRSKKEEENLIEAIIQQKCTSIHPSVKWKFKHEAKRYLDKEFSGEEVSFRKIAFKDVYPLYGQIDIKGSSVARNNATQQDLTLQLSNAKRIVAKALEVDKLPIYEQIIYQIDSFLEGLQSHFQVDSERQVSNFFKFEITPLFEHMKKTNVLVKDINAYFETIDNKLDILYHHRKDYDDTITLINKKMASVLDEKQVEAQKMYPHYFERFKTDGVEHNMYIGESITKEKSFDLSYLHNLRLWQLKMMIEMEVEYYQMRSQFPIQLSVASMILVFNQPLSISFRMDEKQFDVDGTYNARYEIVKKRVDKAFIKGTNERITQEGKIAIVYSQKEDEIEYLNYIKFLQSKNCLGDDIEIVELQDLQAVTGLKAIRVNVLYPKKDSDKEYYKYEDLIDEIQS